MNLPIPSGNAAIARFAGPVYLISLLWIFGPPLERLLDLQTFFPTNAQWRFGVVGLISGAALYSLLGMLLGLLTAVLSGNRWMYRLYFTMTVIAALGLALALGLFVLDAVQIRGSPQARAVPNYDMVVIKALLFQTIQVGAFIALMLAGWRASRSMPRPAPVQAGGLIRG